MAKILSNELKAVVVLEDLTENPANILKDKCLTVQKFDYDCVRKRTQKGGVYGAINPVILSFTVRVNDQLQALRFFKAIISNYVTSLSFLFNATYDPMQRLKDYEDGVVAKGYVVGVEEVYQTDSTASGEFRQMLLNVKLLASSVTYLGYEDNNNLKGVFINNKEEKDKDEERMS